MRGLFGDERQLAEAELEIEWLKGEGFDEGMDILIDENSKPYVIIENETDHSDGYAIEKKRIYLPEFTETEIDAYLTKAYKEHDPAFESAEEEENERNLIDLQEQEKKEEDDNYNN